MDQPANNIPLSEKLKKVLESDGWELLSYSAHQDHYVDWPHGTNYGNVNSLINLELTFVIEQSKDLRETSYILENEIMNMISNANGVFIGRNVHMAYKDGQPSTIVYRLKLSSFDMLEASLEQTYRSKLDAEFTKELEAKLSED